jgi:hypothetical protein
LHFEELLCTTTNSAEDIRLVIKSQVNIQTTEVL